MQNEINKSSFDKLNLLTDNELLNLDSKVYELICSYIEIESLRQNCYFSENELVFEKRILSILDRKNSIFGFLGKITSNQKQNRNIELFTKISILFTVKGKKIFEKYKFHVDKVLTFIEYTKNKIKLREFITIPQVEFNYTDNIDIHIMEYLQFYFRSTGQPPSQEKKLLLKMAFQFSDLIENDTHKRNLLNMFFKRTSPNPWNGYLSESDKLTFNSVLNEISSLIENYNEKDEDFEMIYFCEQQNYLQINK